jgi:anhydro-N-acetylmuramic acid kinase
MTPPRIARLGALAARPERAIVGLMSGTSLDGLDIALCRVRGHGESTAVALEHFVTRSYDPEQQARLREVVSQERVSLRDLTVLNAWLADLHAGLVLGALAEWGVPPARVDALASHGQTVYHAPGSWGGGAAHATLQLGDGDHLAVRTGILTVSDFRQKELAGGGQGAPLAPYADALLFRGDRPRILLNLGGIANFTWLPPKGSAAPIRHGDTGPANTLLDRAVRRYFPDRQRLYDVDGALAAQGRVHARMLALMKDHAYFRLPCPKSTGPETFGEDYLETALLGAQHEPVRGPDVLATLTRLTAETVAEALLREGQVAGVEVFVSGGGRHNRTLMRELEALLPGAVLADSAALGVPPDAKEALLFAVLANETLAGAGFPAADGSGRRIGFGKVSFPD